MGHSSQTPAQFNAALGPGYNASVMQISQNIPLDPYNYVTGAFGFAFPVDRHSRAAQADGHLHPMQAEAG